MKLRNKKTGELVDAWSFYDGNESVNLKYFTNDRQVNLEYRSLAELNGEWEDYKPVEPLIEDQKARKVVRVWAEAFGVTKVYVCGIGDGKEYIELYAQDNGAIDGRIRISISMQNGVWIGKEYTVDELCGEEE